VVGATNRRDLLDPAILSRFGEEVEIGLPSDEQRIEILTKQLHLKGASDKLPSRAVELTQGFSGRDLENLAGRIVREHGDKPISNEVLEKFTQSFRKQGSTGTDPNARWDRLVLSDKTLKELKTLAGLLQHAESFTQRGINVPKGLLLYGPPGTGKTQIARTLANETGLRFIAATTADIKQGYIGQSGQKVKELFERARESSPCLLFIDELDIVAPVRGASLDYITQEIIGQLLQEIDGVKAQTQRVFVLAATNRPDQIDPAVLSRFTKSIEIPLPDEHGRERLLRVLLKKKPIGFDLNEGARILARRTDGMSGRDLVNLIEYAEQTAVGRAIEEGKPDSVEIRLEDFARG
jgi:SpoVK/Ycf46/Vps4 family AAA+-type ATPase